MKKILFLATVILMIVGCGEDEKREIVLNTNSISIYAGDTLRVTAGERVEWKSDDVFVATVSLSGVVIGKHVGKTTIKATSDGGQAACQVEVKPKYNTFTEPVLEFGAGKSVIKAKEKRTLVKDDAEGLSYSGENDAVTAVKYVFENEKLKTASVRISEDYMKEASKFLSERYESFEKIFINNDIYRYTMGVVLTEATDYSLIVYMPR